MKGLRLIKSYLKKKLNKEKRKLIKLLPLSLQYYFGGRKFIASQIQSARAIALKRYGNKCAMSGSTEELVGHHLFDVSTFPFWAASPWNFIFITSSLHDTFHEWNGGTHVPCTIFHFWVWRYFVAQFWLGYGSIGAIIFLIYLPKLTGG